MHIRLQCRTIQLQFKAIRQFITKKVGHFVLRCLTPRVFNSLSHENIDCYDLLPSSWTREEKCHDRKQPCIIWLSYKQNRPLLRMKGEFFKEWYDRFHNPRKKVVKCVGDKGQDEKMRWTFTETDKGRNFLFIKFSVDFFLTERKIFSCKRQK